ncbi:nuclear transport factor 2 family protein [Maribacter sp. 2308TA10-17]|uniref:nuclear transport factor 2 family protein n=1 Tax=Maribacter sp. 2308TA10-17 TaxID=3386276 RepID=UPI0039BCCD26
MKKLLLVTTLLLPFFISAQNALETEVEGVIKAFFEGFHKADTVLMKKTMADEIVFQTAFKNKEQKDILKTDDVSSFVKAIGSGRPVDEKWEERISSYTVKVDGNMAHAWTEYEFWLDGKFSHCGVNSFQLFHDNGTWKIIYLIDTRRRSSCEAYKKNKL